MCGILGIVAEPGGTVDLEGSAVLRMRDCMSDRGPDDAGDYFRRNVAFAHRRLAIRDLTAGRQPWASDDRQTVLVYNGELYNDAALRRELAANGHRFTTRCDTEVLMAAYRQWGADCVHRLRGMFAFGVYDFRDDSLLLVRDRFGIKPLFFAEVDGCLVFASSIPAILAHPTFHKRPHWPAISHYLTTFRLTLGWQTVYEGIQQLLPGERLRFQNGTASIERYWDYPAAECESLGRHTAATQLRDQLTDAVGRRLVGDVPVGMFLSGGVDSNVIACLIRKATMQPMLARCGGGDEDTAGDFAHARRCAEFGRFDFGEVRVRPGEYRDVWNELLSRYQTPLSTPTDVIIHRLSQEMKRHVGVVLGGEGADELLCGYSVQHWAGNDFDRLLAGGSDRLLRTSLRRQFGRDQFATRTDFYFALNSLIPTAAKSSLFREDIWDAAGRDKEMFATYSRQLDTEGEESTARRYTKLLHRVNLEGLLSRLDSATMAAGLEARVPYTDHHLVESMFRVPMRLKIDAAHHGPPRPYCAAELERRGELRSKKLLRSVAAKLMPPELANRKKASFPTPVAGWLSRDWSSSVRETLLSPVAGEIFRRDTLTELADNLSTAGMWLWPIVNVIQWAEREFGAAA